MSLPDIKGVPSSAVWLLIPCFNVGRYLPELLRETAAFIPADRTLIVDDGSTDDTSRVASDAKAHLISHAQNRGKGAALRTGFNYLLEHGAEWCITLDGDGQHDAQYLPRFLESTIGGDYELVIGARQRTGTNMPWDRRFSNWSTSLLLSRFTRQKIYDAQCGYRLIRMPSLIGMTLNCDHYDLETELLLKMARRGARIGWLPVTTHYAGSRSSINRLTDTLRFLRVILQYGLSNH
jgi:glycosyltransferase involved in cell wall biosynthesis